MPAKPGHAHGALFDQFPQGLQSLHGGARFDEGFQLQDKSAPKGDKFDEFGQPSDPDQTGHGPVWDEWGWKDMPDIHGGLLFDDGFREDTANETSRGPLFDLFEPSTQVKFIYDGQDAEGIVNQVRSDGVVMVTPRRGGKPVEVGLEQFLAYRSPSMDNAGTTAERSEAEAPSAWSPVARGGDHNTVPTPSDAGVPTSAPDPGSPVEATPQGMATEPRSSTDVDWSPIQSLKTALGDELDVTKADSNGYRMERHGDIGDGEGGGIRDMHQHFAGQRFIGRSYRFSPGGSIKAQHTHPRSGAMTYLGEHPDHEHAHKVIRAHDESDAAKSEPSALDVLKAAVTPDEWENHASAASGHLRQALRTSSGGSPHFNRALTHLNDAREHQRSAAGARGAMVGYHQGLRNHSTTRAHESTEMGIAAEHGAGGDTTHAQRASTHLGTIRKEYGELLDVLKEHIGFDAMVAKLEGEGHSAEHAKRIAASIGRKKYGAKGMEAKAAAAEKTVRLPSELLKTCSVFDGEPAVRKEVTVAESAIQAQEGASTLAGGKGAGSTYCPECREQKSLTDDGRCPDCNMVLDSHEPGKAKREKGDGNGQGESSAPTGKTFATVEDLAKAFGAAGDPGAGGQTVTSDGKPGDRGKKTRQAEGFPSDEPVEQRSTPESDHNSTTEESHSAGGTCPHCGKPLKELDEKAEQGAPAHKCVEGFLEVLKSHEDPAVGGAAVSPLDALKALA